jgi:hypothetical protein
VDRKCIKTFFRKSEENRPVGRHRHRLDNTKMVLTEIVYEMEWIELHRKGYNGRPL